MILNGKELTEFRSHSKLLSYGFKDGKLLWGTPVSINLTLQAGGANLTTYINNWLADNDYPSNVPVVLTNSINQPSLVTGNLNDIGAVEFINNGTISGTNAGYDALTIQAPILLINNGTIRGAGGNGGNSGNGGVGGKGGKGADIADISEYRWTTKSSYQFYENDCGGGYIDPTVNTRYWCQYTAGTSMGSWAVWGTGGAKAGRWDEYIDTGTARYWRGEYQSTSGAGLYKAYKIAGSFRYLFTQIGSTGGAGGPGGAGENARVGGKGASFTTNRTDGSSGTGGSTGTIGDPSSPTGGYSGGKGGTGGSAGTSGNGGNYGANGGNGVNGGNGGPGYDGGGNPNSGLSGKAPTITRTLGQSAGEGIVGAAFLHADSVTGNATSVIN